MKRAIPYDMKGQFHEMNDNGRLRFFEINYCNYSIEAVNRLIEIDSLQESKLGRYMSLIDGEIPESTEFLYMLQTYIGLPNIDDPWEFNNNTSDYQRFGFKHINDLLEFCKEKWGVTKQDFKSIIYTNIPH